MCRSSLGHLDTHPFVVGQELLDPEVWEFICKYNLDDRVMNRLIDTLNNRKNKRKDTLQARCWMLLLCIASLHCVSLRPESLCCRL